MLMGRRNALHILALAAGISQLPANAHAAIGISHRTMATRNPKGGLAFSMKESIVTASGWERAGRTGARCRRGR